MISCASLASRPWQDVYKRQRLGRENVIFTSGTDCYGSPIMESYRKLKENEGYDKSIAEYVESNHSRQAATLNNYNISCDIYGGSGLEPKKRR